MSQRPHEARCVRVAIGGFVIAFALGCAEVAAEWPWWRGPERSGVAQERLGIPNGETGFAEPEWQRSLGEGCGSVVAFGDRVYGTGWSDGRETVFCLAAEDGRIVWSHNYACPQYGRHAVGDHGWYAGPTATPSFESDTRALYTLGTDGDLRCWDSNRDGALVWAANLYDNYGVPRRPSVGGGQRDYGFTTAPLVHREALLVAVGPPAGLVVALDKRTGKQLWVSESRDFASNCGGMSLIDVDGLPCLVVLSLTRLAVIRLDNGHEGVTLAEYPWQTDYANNLVSPTVVGNRVLLSSDFNIKRTVLLNVARDGIRLEWESRRFSGVGSPVPYGDHLYLPFQTLRCLRLSDGVEVWSGGRFGPDGSCLVTQDGYILVAGSGKLAVVNTAVRSPDAYQELAKIEGLCGQNQAWPHVVLAGGRIYHKDRQGRITCLRLRAGSGRSEVTAAPTATRGVAQASPLATVFSWRAGAAPHDLHARGAASVAQDGSLELAGGSFVLTETAERLLETCRKSHALTLEVEFTAANTEQRGPARIVSFSSDPFRRNFTLGQELDRLVLRLRTPETGDNGMRPETLLGRVIAGRRHHLFVTYVPGRLTWRMDGQAAVDSEDVRGDFSNWERQTLLVGNEASDDRAWLGRLHALRIGSGAGPTPKPPTDSPAVSALESPARSVEALHASVTESRDARGRPMLTITTPNARFVYDLNGGGLASLFDAEGRDWIGHGTENGARGTYRGIPNLINPEGGFHPGDDRCVSRVEKADGAVVAVRSSTTDGKWDCRWTFFDGYAIMDLEKAAHTYWFLYEGTPGARYDEDRTWMMSSAKVRMRANERWEQRLPDPRWIAFGCDGVTRALFLGDLTVRPAEVTDSFWSMDRSMTVFGFGRSLRQGERWHHLREVPARFIVGFADGSNPESLTVSVEKILEKANGE